MLSSEDEVSFQASDQMKVLAGRGSRGHAYVTIRPAEHVSQCADRSERPSVSRPLSDSHAHAYDMG